MAYGPESSAPATEVFKALGDPIRWSIITQMSMVDELACLTLEDTLPVSKPTISYHTKILHQAGLISVRKEGRNYFYSLRRDVLQELIDGLFELAPAPRPVAGRPKGSVRAGTRADAAARQPSRGRGSDENLEEAVVLTW